MNDERENDIAARVRDRINDIETTIKSYEEYIKGKRDQIPLVENKVRECYALNDALTAAGFEPRMSSYCEQIYLSIEEHRMVDLARIVGPLHVAGKTPQPPTEPGKRATLQVELGAKKYPFLSATYVTRIKKGMKCKIITRTEKRREIVCEL